MKAKSHLFVRTVFHLILHHHRDKAEGCWSCLLLFTLVFWQIEVLLLVLSHFHWLTFIISVTSGWIPKFAIGHLTVFSSQKKRLLAALERKRRNLLGRIVTDPAKFYYLQLMKHRSKTLPLGIRLPMDLQDCLTKGRFIWRKRSWTLLFRSFVKSYFRFQICFFTLNTMQSYLKESDCSILRFFFNKLLFANFCDKAS